MMKVLSPSEIIIENGKISIVLPIHAHNEANSSEHWTKKQKRHQQQKFIVINCMKSIKELISMPCCITFTRLSPKFLDAHDNLPMSFKYILDAVTASITGDYRSGLADNNPNFQFKFDQIKSNENNIKILFEFNP